MEKKALERYVKTILILFVVLIWPQLGKAEDAKYYYEKGTDYLREGDLNEAIISLTKAISLTHHFSKAYNNRGIAYYRQQKYAQASEDFMKAIQLNPNEVEAYNNVAIIFCMQRQYDQALFYLKQALALMKEKKRSHADVLNNLGFVYTKKGMYKEAMKAYDHAARFTQYKNEACSNGNSTEGVLCDQIRFSQRIEGHSVTAKFYGQ